MLTAALLLSPSLSVTLSLLLLATTVCATVADAPLLSCSRSLAELPGEWLAAPNNGSTAAADAAALERACPRAHALLLSGRRECVRATGSGPRALRFAPRRCTLGPAHPSPAARLWARLGARRVLLAGDSLAQQQFAALACALERGAAALGPARVAHASGARVEFVRAPLLLGGTCAGAAGRERDCVLRPQTTAGPTRLGARRLDAALERALAPDAFDGDTLLVLSVGHWFSPFKLGQMGVLDVWRSPEAPVPRVHAAPDDDAALALEVARWAFDRAFARIAALEREYEARGRELRVVVRSLPPGHAACRSQAEAADNAKYDWDSVPRKNRMLRRKTESHAWQFIDVYSLGVDRPDAHPGAHYGKVDWKHDGEWVHDCLHLCYGPNSLLDLWNRLLELALFEGVHQF